MRPRFENALTSISANFWSRYLDFLLQKIGSGIFNSTKQFITFDRISLPQFESRGPMLFPDSRYGVVVQGPVIPKLTFEICNHFCRLFPTASIVLSTWTDQDISEFTNLGNANFELIVTKPPENRGPSNINLQLLSSRIGIEYLKSQGCTHVLKTRTDMVLHNPELFNFLQWNLLKGTDKAIVFSSFNSFLFRKYSPSDQVTFSTIENAMIYWGIDLVINDSIVSLPEEYIFKTYLRKNGFEVEDSLDSYWKSLSEFSVFADHDLLGQVWMKGSYSSLSYRWRSVVFPNTMTAITSWHWELMKTHPQYFCEIARLI